MEILKIIIFVSLFLFNACTINEIPTPQERINKVISLIKKKKLNFKLINTDKFDLFAVMPNRLLTCKCIKVYIEGDGLAWLNSYTVSENPTPINPIGLKLFLEDNSNCKVYLSRPCQYLSKRNCSYKYWTNKRFSYVTINAYKTVLSKLKKRVYNKKFILIGFSGGGTIAALLAAQRNDIKTLITIAGNLNPKYWCEYHKISYLNGSLNPVFYSDKLEKIEQFHFVGGKDKIIPKVVSQSYLKNFYNKKHIHLIEVSNATHTKGWQKSWKEFLSKNHICRY